MTTVYLPEKGVLLWSDAGKPSAINVAIMGMKRGFDNVEFIKAEPLIIFNDGEEPRGIASYKETLFYAAIYK